MTELQKSFRKIVILTFPSDRSNRPIICNLARMFDLTFNILKAQITPRKEGFMNLELSGSEENYRKAVDYLKEQGIKVSAAAQKVSRDEDSCVQCGTCTAICPSEALWLQPSSRAILFDKDRCTACGRCIRVCPVRAMHAEVDNGSDW